jgi:hypothetical protein
MSLTQATINWNAKEYVGQVRQALEEIIEDGAKQTAEDAKRNLERAAPDSTGKLASEIDIRASQFKDGGWLVEAQGPGNYGRFYASFVELGSVNNEPVGYLRRALRRNLYRMRAKLRKALDAMVTP